MDKRSLGPHMQALIGPWRMAMCDPYPESARHATEAFKAAIPPKKRRQVLLYLSTPALIYLNDKMRAQLGGLPDPYGAEDPAPEVVEERYERIVSTAILALARLIEEICVRENEEEGETKVQELKVFRTGRKPFSLKQILTLVVLCAGEVRQEWQTKPVAPRLD